MFDARTAEALTAGVTGALEDGAPDVAFEWLAAAGDVAILMGLDGHIEDVAINGEGALAEAARHWRGRRLADTVAGDSVSKVEALLDEAQAGGPGRRREINHVAPDGGATPVRYAVFAQGERIVAIGQDLAPLAQAQTRLMRAQAELDREGEKLRGFERRFRALFRLTHEPMLLVASGDGVVTEANPAAEALVGSGSARFRDLFAAEDSAAAAAALASLLAGHAPERTALRLRDGEKRVMISGAAMQMGVEGLALIRLEDGAGGAPQSLSARALRDLPDAVAIIDDAGRLMDANPAFVDLIGAPAIEAALGRPVDEWFERPGVDLPALLGGMRAHGAVRRFPSRLRDALGAEAPVEIWGAALRDEEQPTYALSVRVARAPVGGASEAPLSRSADDISSLIGQAPLKDLVREAADAIEKLGVEAALKTTGGNRARAAQLLGLSRQSLYAKLARHGIGEEG